MIPVRDGEELEVVKELLDRLGFQGRDGGDPFPETRPLRVGSWVHDGEAFLLHVHVIPETSPEVDEMRFLRSVPPGRPGIEGGLCGEEKEDHRQRRDRFAGVLQDQEGVLESGAGGVIDAGSTGQQNEGSKSDGFSRCAFLPGTRKSVRPRRSHPEKFLPRGVCHEEVSAVLGDGRFPVDRWPPACPRPGPTSSCPR